MVRPASRAIFKCAKQILREQDHTILTNINIKITKKPHKPHKN